MPHEHKSLRQYIRMLPARIPVRQNVPCKPIEFEKHPSALRQENPVPVQHLHSCPTRLRMFIHETAQGAQALLSNYRIRMEQQHIFPPAQPYRLIARLRKAVIILIFYQGNLRKSFPDISRRPVGRVIVNHKHLHIHTCRSSLHGAEALFEEILCVVIDNDNGKLDFVHGITGVSVLFS
ncbi:hypothetical protein Barb4_03742 [Bacteroidales bacterium Barb4]|nr:hypothetical protein Barb4_03742 [Bacteroidales bacterium Barb4]